MKKCSSLRGTKQSPAQSTYIKAINSKNMKYGGCIYLLTNKHHTVLYTGVTSDLKKRMYQHQSKEFNNSFTARYNCSKLVYFENFIRIEEAIAREKQIKGGSRKAKETLINLSNPEWKDLWEVIKDW
jgi:putative endonuclease